MIVMTTQDRAGTRMDFPTAANGSESELLQRYAATQDAGAFQELVGRHADLVYATCLRIVADPHTADDAGQAVFLVFAKKARSLRADTPLAGWFYRTSVFVAQRAIRERRNRRKYEQEAAAMRSSEHEADGAGSGGETAFWSELKPQLDTLLAALPVAERDAVVLRYLAGKSEPEAARALNCPVGTLSARVSRAIARLRQRFARGTAVPATLIALALEQHARHAAPAHFVSSIHAACLGTAGASAAATQLAEGTMKALFWIKVKMVAAVLLISTLVGVPVTMRLTAGESNPVVNGGASATPAIPSMLKPAPTTVDFAPRATTAPLYYERVTQIECTDRPAITSAINGLLPEHSIDCHVFEMTARKQDGAVAVHVQDLKSNTIYDYSTEKDGKPVKLKLFAYSVTTRDKMPECTFVSKPDGSFSLEKFESKGPVKFIIGTPGVTGDLERGDGGLGIFLLDQVGFAPLCSTAGKARAVHDSWENTIVLQERFKLPIVYSLKSIERVNGRVVATLQSAAKKIEMSPEVLPSEAVTIAGMAMTLEPKSLSGECVEDVQVDAELGVVLHHQRRVTAKLGYTLNLPAGLPEAIRKMAGGDLLLGVRFTIEDTLLSEAQKNVLIGAEQTPEALKQMQTRWEKMLKADDPYVQALAEGILGQIAGKKTVPAGISDF